MRASYGGQSETRAGSVGAGAHCKHPAAPICRQAIIPPTLAACSVGGRVSISAEKQATRSGVRPAAAAAGS